MLSHICRTRGEQQSQYHSNLFRFCPKSVSINRFCRWQTVAYLFLLCFVPVSQHEKRFSSCGNLVITHTHVSRKTFLDWCLRYIYSLFLLGTFYPKWRAPQLLGLLMKRQDDYVCNMYAAFIDIIARNIVIRDWENLIFVFEPFKNINM